MGNEIGTHSYTHPEDTNVLTPAQIQFEFQQSKQLLEQQLGITIKGAAVPGAPESLATSKLIGQYFSYMSGGYTGVGRRLSRRFRIHHARILTASISRRT